LLRPHLLGGRRGERAPVRLAARRFRFSNDTALAYGIDEAGELQINRREEKAEFAHRCFVLARGVMQFHKFARFAPEQPRVSRAEYRRRVRQLCKIPVWSRAPPNGSSSPDTAICTAFHMGMKAC
jgi:hypothetical protein